MPCFVNDAVRADRAADACDSLLCLYALADCRCCPTRRRGDTVYVGNFKCNISRIVDYPNLWPYVRDLYQSPGVSQTVDLDHIKRNYYATHPGINPTGVVPAGPLIDFAAPHDRAGLG